MQQSFLPELDRKKTQDAVEEAFKKYRLYKFLSYDDCESSITAGYNERFHGPTNQTSDQTASIAIKNVDDQAARRAYCERIERVVNRLPRMERFLIQERMMGQDSEYITDYAIYCHHFNPPISDFWYYKIKWKAFYKIALALDIQVLKQQTDIPEE